MFNLEALLTPLTRYVRDTVRQGLHRAFQQGAKDFTDDLSALVRERPVADHAAMTRLLLLGSDAEPVAVAMPSAARVTEADESPAEAVSADVADRARELMASGCSQREAARQLGIAESTLRGIMKR
jgi:DNA-binding NarL/FixJ family response regulator